MSDSFPSQLLVCLPVLSQYFWIGMCSCCRCLRWTFPNSSMPMRLNTMCCRMRCWKPLCPVTMRTDWINWSGQTTSSRGRTWICWRNYRWHHSTAPTSSTTSEQDQTWSVLTCFKPRFTAFVPVETETHFCFKRTHLPEQLYNTKSTGLSILKLKKWHVYIMYTVCIYIFCQDRTNYVLPLYIPLNEEGYI